MVDNLTIGRCKVWLTIGMCKVWLAIDRCTLWLTKVIIGSPGGDKETLQSFSGHSHPITKILYPTK